MTLIVREDAELLKAADLVVHATVINAEPVLHENGRVYTHVELQIREVWKGEATLAHLTLIELGGEAEGRFDWVPGFPAYRMGQEVVVFAVHTHLGWSTLDGWSGAFEVRETRRGRAVLVRAQTRESVQLFRVGFEPFEDTTRAFSEFRRGVVGSFRAVKTDDYRVSEPVNLEKKIGHQPSEKWKPIYSGTPYRWGQFDSSVAEPWYYGNGPQVGFSAGNTSGDGPPEFARALATWTNDPSSKIFLSNGGAHSPYGDGWAGGVDDVSEVLFNDPYNEISGSFSCSSGGVLAFGGAHGVYYPAHSFRGGPFYTVEEGDVVFQDWPSDCSWLDSESLTEVIAHEVGHALVFGHSYEKNETHNTLTDDALMRWTAHGGSLADTLGEDDRCVAYWMYPVARVDTVLSPNSSAVASPGTVSPSGTATVTVTLHDGSSAVSGQIVRASVETASGSASGTLDDGNAYPDSPLQDNGDGTYSTQITVGSGEGSLTIRFKVNCCDNAVPAPPESCDEFSPTATLVVSAAAGDAIFDDDFEDGHTGNWSSTVPPP